MRNRGNDVEFSIIKNPIIAEILLLLVNIGKNPFFGINVVYVDNYWLQTKCFGQILFMPSSSDIAAYVVSIFNLTAVLFWWHAANYDGIENIYCY